jgi:hypothetical protein
MLIPVHPTPNGTIQCGPLTLPAWMAADLAVRLAEAAESTTASTPPPAPSPCAT